MEEQTSTGLGATRTAMQSRGLSPIDLVRSIGGGLLDVVVAGSGVEIDDLTVAEPALDVRGQAGDLLLAIGIDAVDAARALVDHAADNGVAAVAFRHGTAHDPGVGRAARDGGVALLALSEQASWAHVVWLLRGVLDRVHAPRSDAAGSSHDELFALADGCAALLDAPVTIEDPHSRVLAYSSLQDAADPIRVATIVGRRVPAEVLASLRGRGVFRRLARAEEPFFVPAAPDGVLRPRLVVPIRAGRERLGSIWAVVDDLPAMERVRAVQQTASVVALHLLRMRSEVDLARRVTADRLRELLTGGATADGTTSDGVPVRAWLPPAPWRVAILDGGGPDPLRRSELWESALRRASWRQPLLTTVDQLLLVLVTETGSDRAGGDRSGGATPGTWPWLVDTAHDLAAGLPSGVDGIRVAAGRVAGRAEELRRSRDDAYEVARLQADGVVVDPIARFDREWAAVTTARAVASLGPDGRRGGTDQLLGPIAQLHGQGSGADAEHLTTLAAWLDHPGDPRAAAARLHVHPNTLRYRMTRITERLGADLADPQVRLALRLQLRALGR